MGSRGSSSDEASTDSSASDDASTVSSVDEEASSSAAVVVTDIEELHRLAIMDKQSTYVDPTTGFTAFTELAHLKRGKCCGNLCRHCPYGWSNVRSASGSPDGDARAISGDREMTGRLVRRIMDGTYYEEDECAAGGELVQRTSAEETAGGGANGAIKRNATGEFDGDAQNQSTPPAASRGKGGRAGGALTSKNVPYTRTGDKGTSQLFTGERRSKDDVLFEAMGTVDELCSIVGVVYAELTASIDKRRSGGESVEGAKSDASTTAGGGGAYGDLPEQLLEVMSRLFDVGSHIARPAPRNQRSEGATDGNKTKVGFRSHHAGLLEEWIDTMTDQLPELTSFILPTGSLASAQLHAARTVCRRAERRMVPLVRDEETADPAALAYVNRLSDYFFTAARFVNYCEDRDEVQYRREGRGLSEERRKDSDFHRERVVVKLKK